MKSANVPGGRVNGERARIRQMNTIPEGYHSPPNPVNRSGARRIVGNAGRDKRSMPLPVSSTLGSIQYP